MATEAPLLTDAELKAAIVEQIYAGVEKARAAGIECGPPIGIKIRPLRSWLQEKKRTERDQ